jgi:hypothetical protein
MSLYCVTVKPEIARLRQDGSGTRRVQGVFGVDGRSLHPFSRQPTYMAGPLPDEVLADPRLMVVEVDRVGKDGTCLVSPEALQAELQRRAETGEPDPPLKNDGTPDPAGEDAATGSPEAVVGPEGGPGGGEAAVPPQGPSEAGGAAGEGSTTAPPPPPSEDEGSAPKEDAAGAPPAGDPGAQTTTAVASKAKRSGRGARGRRGARG